MEALILSWEQVNWNQKQIHPEPGTTKNKEGRVFPFDGCTDLEKLLLRQKWYTEQGQKVRFKEVPWVSHR